MGRDVHGSKGSTHKTVRRQAAQPDDKCGAQTISPEVGISASAVELESLQQEKALLDKLFNATTDTLFLFDPITGKPLRWNKHFAEVSGYSDDEIARMKAPEDFYSEADIAKAKSVMSTALAEGSSKVEISLITKQGALIPFEYNATAIESADGKSLLLSIGRDLTERKRTEAALQESEKRLSESQEMAQLGYWSWDVKTGNVEWSKEVYSIFRLEPSEFTPQIDSILALSPWPEDHERDKELIQRAMDTHEKGEYEQEFLRQTIASDITTQLSKASMMLPTISFPSSGQCRTSRNTSGRKSRCGRAKKNSETFLKTRHLASP